jgi:hypothetical protein
VRAGDSIRLDRQALRRMVVPGAAAVIAGLGAGAVVLFVTRGSYDLWGSLLFAPVLALVSVPILRRAARGDDEQWLLRIFLLALAAKLAGTFVRYAIVEAGGGDALGYDRTGEVVADIFRARDWDSPVLGEYLPQLTGTPFIRLVVGLLYTVTGPTILGGFLFFSWLGFWGQVLFVNAFRLAVPAGRLRLYAVLILFLPSLLFWPSSIGKESWMMFCLGASAYGAARLLASRRGGIPVLVAGLVGTAMVRPHVTLIVFAALVTAYVLRRPTKPTAVHRVGKLLGIAALLVAGLLVAGAVQRFFDLQGLDAEAVDLVLDETGRRSGQGGSEFDNVRATSPARYPGAVIQVLFRPFPFEANNAQAMVASAEGLVLLALFAISIPRLARLPSHAIRRPYVAFAVTYSALFVLAFSAIGNFGILVRQRTQVYPFIIVAVALPATMRALRTERTVESEVLATVPASPPPAARTSTRPERAPRAGRGRPASAPARLASASRTSPSTSSKGRRRARARPGASRGSSARSR